MTEPAPLGPVVFNTNRTRLNLVLRRRTTNPIRRSSLLRRSHRGRLIIIIIIILIDRARQATRAKRAKRAHRASGANPNRLAPLLPSRRGHCHRNSPPLSYPSHRTTVRTTVHTTTIPSTPPRTWVLLPRRAVHSRLRPLRTLHRTRHPIAKVTGATVGSRLPRLWSYPFTATATSTTRPRPRPRHRLGSLGLLQRHQGRHRVARCIRCTDTVDTVAYTERAPTTLVSVRVPRRVRVMSTNQVRVLVNLALRVTTRD